jgi:hypothetical protein
MEEELSPYTDRWGKLAIGLTVTDITTSSRMFINVSSNRASQKTYSANLTRFLATR